MKLQWMKSSMLQWINLLQKQQVCDMDSSGLCCAKNWIHTPSASGSYSRQAENLIALNFFVKTEILICFWI